MGKRYISYSNGDWHPERRPRHMRKNISGDPARSKIHDLWFQHDTGLQVGNVTFGWLHEATLSCRKLQQAHVLEDIRTPILLAIAGKEHLVDNRATEKAVAIMPHARLLKLPESGHEIMMECDNIRNNFFRNVRELLKNNGICRK